MAVTFILGRGGAGKTRACVDAVLAGLSQPDETRRLILLVPEQASFQMERALATRAPRGGYWRADVLSFTRLARRVIEQTGPELTVLSPQARALALRCIAAQDDQALRVLAPAARSTGFYIALDRLIEELLRENVAPNALTAAAGRLTDAPTAEKVRELGRLYAGYLAWLGPERTDAATRLAVLRDRLAGLSWLREAAIWVDGFAGFTGQELETLVVLARTARDMTISLLLDPAGLAVQQPTVAPDPLGLFQRTEVTYQRLRRLFEDAGVRIAAPITLPPAVLPRFTQAPMLAALEAGLATPAAGLAGGQETARPRTGGPDVSPSGDVVLCECATHRDELRAAARWMRRHLADANGRLRYRDFAVIARDLEPFAATIAEVFAEYELPYFLDRRRPLRAHPLSRLVPALFEAAETDFEVSPMVRLLRTRLVPLSRDQAEQLENLVVNDAVRGSTLWRQPRWELEHARAGAEAFFTQRMRIVAAIEPLLTLVQRHVPQPAATWARTLHEVLTKLGVRAMIETWVADARAERRWESAETHRLAWEALCEVLDDLHAVLGDTPVSAGDVAAILESALGDLTLGLAPPTVDQVLVSSIERSRHPDIKHAWVFAFNEGVFPARPAEDTLLSTGERDALAHAGLAAPASHREDALGERLLAYIAFTRPSQSLTISFATVADDGMALQPSPLLADVLRVLPGLRATHGHAHEPPVSLPELVRGYLSTRRDERRRAEHRRYERLCEFVRGSPAGRERLDWLLRGVTYDNRPVPVPLRRQAAGGADDVAWDGSPSEVETYLRCPFKHFATHRLRLDPLRGPHPLRWDLGSVAHELLAAVTRRAMDEPGGVRALSDDRWQQLLAAAAETYWQRQPADLKQRRPELVFLGSVLTKLLRDLVAAHAARWRRGEFVPRYCEQPFRPDGPEDGLRGVQLALADGRCFRVHGQIDRVDAGDAGKQTLLLVYDYKSSAGSIRGGFLTGQRLQLFTYLLALQQTFEKGSRVRPAGVLLAPLYPDLAVLDKKYAAKASEAERLMYMYRPRGLFDEAAAALLDTGHKEGQSPVAQMQRKKDGGLYKNADAVPASAVDDRLELARQTVLLAAEGIVAGQIEVAPLVENRTLACCQCEFQAVCRFDRVFNRPRAAERVLPTLGPDGGNEGEDE